MRKAWLVWWIWGLVGVVSDTWATALPSSSEVAPTSARCPSGLPPATRCWAGTDSAGAHYLIAVPALWNRTLVLHAHGGPFLGTPTAERVSGDLQRWRVVVSAGYAWAGSSYRQGGVAVRAAAEDTERLRGIFNQWIERPKRTILHGQSWGASVAAKGAEMFRVEDSVSMPYDAVLLTSGVLAGGSQSYDFRLDLRVIYQYLCNNHPLPQEPQYPLWMGLAPHSKMTTAALAQRVQSCLGLGHNPEDRTPTQTQNLQTILNVIRIPERAVQSHLNWATFHFRDIYLHRTGGGNIFDNAQVQYKGSGNDDALNAGVARYRSDPQAVARFAHDTDLSGRIAVPVLTVHGVDDPIAFVEMEDTFRQTMVQAGNADHLVQTFTRDAEHSYLGDAAYATLLTALGRWLDSGKKPTPQSIADACASHEKTVDTGCRFLPEYRPASLASRVAPRRPLAP